MDSSTRLIICAWCGERQSGEIEPASHGICPACSQTFMAQANVAVATHRHPRHRHVHPRRQGGPSLMRAVMRPASFMAAAFIRFSSSRP